MSEEGTVSSFVLGKTKSLDKLYKNFKVGKLNVHIEREHDDYTKKVCCSMWHGVSNMMIAIVNFMALWYTIVSGDVHVGICTFAFQTMHEGRKPALKPCLKTSKDYKNKELDLKMGPVRLIMIEEGSQYAKNMFLSICNALSQMMIGAMNLAALGYSITTGDAHVCICTMALMIGAVNVVILGYAIVSRDAHAYVCTAAWHFFTVEAILAFSYTNGWASPMRMQHKKMFHIIFQVTSLICIITGSVLIFVKKGISALPHGITGLIGLIMTGITVASGPTALLDNQNIILFHICVGLPTFLITSLCLILGIATSAFQAWCGKPLAFILIFLIIFYSLFIFVTTVIKCYMRIKYIRLL